MAYTVLGQSFPAAATATLLYTADTQTVVSSLVVCNQSAVPTTFRVSIRVSGVSDATKQYLYYDVPIDGNDTFVSTIGITLNATDLVYVYSTLSTVSFNLFGSTI